MSECEQVVPVTAINVFQVPALQATLSQAAKQSLDRRFGALYDKVYQLDVLFKADLIVINRVGIFVKRKHNDSCRGIRNVSSDFFYALVFIDWHERKFLSSEQALGKTVGEPYRGKPDVRFDEGDLRTIRMDKLARHQSRKRWQTDRQCHQFIESDIYSTIRGFSPHQMPSRPKARSSWPKDRTMVYC